MRRRPERAKAPGMLPRAFINDFSASEPEAASQQTFVQSAEPVASAISIELM